MVLVPFNGDEPWLSCSPLDDSLGEDENCEFWTVSVVELIGTDVMMCHAGTAEKR